MLSSPEVITMLAKARHQEFLAEAERHRLCRSAQPRHARPPILAAFVRTLLDRVRSRSGGSRMSHPAEGSPSAIPEVVA